MLQNGSSALALASTSAFGMCKTYLAEVEYCGMLETLFDILSVAHFLGFGTAALAGFLQFWQAALALMLCAESLKGRIFY